MATINFYLKKSNKEGEAPIMLTYQNKGEKFRYYTKLKVQTSSWKGQRVKNNYTGFCEINSLLDDMENTLKSIEREGLFNKTEYSVDTIKRKFFIAHGCVSQQNDFFKIYDQFMEEAKATKREGTIKAYGTTKNKLLSFSEAKKHPINFENINSIFYEAFIHYLIKDLKHLNNTVGKHIKTLKAFMNYAISQQYVTNNTAYTKFKVLREEADIIYLTEAELMKLLYLENLPARLIPVRDNFCFSCFTGLRFSDIDKLRKMHLKNNYIEIKTDKTKDFLKIPLNRYAIEILNRYADHSIDRPLPTGVSNCKTNLYLKEIGELAGVTEMVSMEKFSGSQKVVINKPKYELISSHTARRTFVTLALEKGMRAEVVMAMTGHKDYKTFKKYIKITDKVMETEMNRIWNEPLLKAI